MVILWVMYFGMNALIRTFMLSFLSLKDPGYQYGITRISHQHASPEVSGISFFTSVFLHHLRIRPDNAVILFVVLPCLSYICKPYFALMLQQWDLD